MGQVYLGSAHAPGLPSFSVPRCNTLVTLHRRLGLRDRPFFARMKLSLACIFLCLGTAVASGLSPKTTGISLGVVREAIGAISSCHWMVNSTDAELFTFFERSLIMACEKGDIDRVSKLLRFGVGVDCKGNASMKAAVKGGHAEVVDELIHHGAPINHGSFCARAEAVFGGHDSILRVLPYEDASTPICEYCKQLKETFDEISLLSKEEIDAELAAFPGLQDATCEVPFAAPSHGKLTANSVNGDDSKRVDICPEEDRHPSGIVVGKELTICSSKLEEAVPLSDACHETLLDSYSQMRQKAVAEGGSSTSTQKDIDERRAKKQELLDATLEAAVAAKNCKQIGILLAQGASRERYLVPVKASGRSKSKGPSKMRVATADEVQEVMDRALVETAASGSVNQMKDLIGGGANPKYDRDAPLKAAVHGNNPQAILCLMDAGAVFDGSITHQPIVWASSLKHFDLLKRLMEHPSALPVELNRTLVHAAMRNDEVMAKLILDKGADPNYEGGVALVYAARYNNSDLAELLLDYGALPYSDKMVKIKFDDSMSCPQHVLCNVKFSNGVGKPCIHNALIEAATKRHDRVVDVLAKRGSDLRVLGDDAIIHAVRSASLEEFQSILGERVYPKKHLNLALEESLYDSRCEALSLLLIEHGASPLDVALETIGKVKKAEEYGAVKGKEAILEMLSYLLLVVCRSTLDLSSVTEFVHRLGGRDAFRMGHVISNLLTSDHFSKALYLFKEFNLPISIFPTKGSPLVGLALIRHWDGVMEALAELPHDAEQLNKALFLSADSDRPDLWRMLLDRGGRIEVILAPLDRMRIAAAAGHIESVSRILNGIANRTIGRCLVVQGLHFAMASDMIELLEAAKGAFSEHSVEGAKSSSGDSEV